jgi:hydrogenase maturation protein HypF
LLGGDQAVREPWRIALSLLQQADPALLPVYSERLASGELATAVSSEFPARIPDSADREYSAPSLSEMQFAARLLETSTGTVLTSALGRLFDGVAAILGLTLQSTYEGQAPMELESVARLARQQSLPAGLCEQNCPLDWRAIIRWLATAKETLANRAHAFHQWAAQAFVHAALACPRGQPGGELLATGGCMQNTLLLEMLRQECGRTGLRLVTHRENPAGDGGLALGILLAARTRTTRST